MPEVDNQQLHLASWPGELRLNLQMPPDFRTTRQREHQLELDSRWDVHECRRLQREGNEELIEAIGPFG